MTKREKLQHCTGCRNNFYNGHNPMGVSECWHLKDAKMVKRIRIGVWQNPPYNTKRKVKVFNCRTEDGNVLVKPEALASNGYWRW